MAGPIPPSGACTKSATLTISWTETTPAPADGYLVRYRAITNPATSAWVEWPGTTSSPQSYSVSACYDYEVEVYADCGPTMSTAATYTANKVPSTVYISTTAPGVSITNVTGITGYTFSGPLLAGSAQQVSSGVHNGFSTIITVTLSGSATLASNLTLYKNEVKMQCLAVPQGAGAAGTYSFSSVSFAYGDEVRISMGTGNCV